MKHQLGDITLWEPNGRLEIDEVYLVIGFIDVYNSGRQLDLIYKTPGRFLTTKGSIIRDNPIYCTSFRKRPE